MLKSAFLYGTMEEEVYVHQPPGFVDPAHPNKVYKVVKALYGLHQAPKAWYETLSSFLLENGFRRGTIDKILFIKKNKSDIIFQMSSMGELTFFLGLQVKQQPDGIFISQDKYVADILKKFDFWSIRTATTPIESNKPLVKDEDGVDVDVHVYRSMIGSLMYLTASRLDIIFAVCACARSWYPKDSPFELEAFSDSDYGGASLDRKSTTAANCCGQVLWIQNQMMDYGFNFMTTKIHIDNESTISVIKNPVAHSRTKHIEIRFHFIRDCYDKRLIEVIKIHTDYNVADLLTKRFDVTRFNFLVVSIRMTSMDLRMDGTSAGSFSPIWMINLRYSDKHNMVSFLKKPNESVGFTEIVDFLKGTSLRTLANGIQELVASIDNKEYTITEASVRSKLQLTDATRIHNLPDAEIYEGLAILGYVSEGKLTFWKKNFTPQWKFLIHNILHCISPKSGEWDQFGSPIATALICLSSNRVYNFSKLIFDGMVHNLESNTKFLMGYAGDHVPLLPAMLAGAAPDQDKSTTTRVGVDTEGATTTTTSLDSGLDSGNINVSPPRSHDTPLYDVNMSRSVENSLKLKLLSLLVPKLELKIGSLEKELKDTKQTFGNAIL
ncbi:putative ribonuclease H-like domain-containing protein, partial [Tanacetum coccineum]